MFMCAGCKNDVYDKETKTMKSDPWQGFGAQIISPTRNWQLHPLHNELFQNSFSIVIFSSNLGWNVNESLGKD